MKERVLNQNEVKKEMTKFATGVNPDRMEQIHREEFISRIKGMSQEEMELVADLIPIEFCFNRIKKELDKSKQFEENIKAAMNGLN